ncbi:coiled-coil domain-containing protein 125 [Rhinatrema bivittatum]|uniref:coiled-coil domain-containing protein 125 n=1 Tax=Rhinatrema bivittatum TaxID=194408 RepID=UPI00112C23DB|nr:coiled-coil domain-containing protein 125 [Rhinatrema bivittatum]XP_029430177.1 coiled-coil domain-containing protein 125 [Rhinatrema bivittatum]
MSEGVPLPTEQEHENGPNEEEEDFLAGGDLGDGYGRRPGGVYETAEGVSGLISKSRKSLDDRGFGHCLLMKKGDDNGTASFQGAKCSNSCDASSKRPGIDVTTRCSSDKNHEMSNAELRQQLQEVTEELEILRSELEASQRQLEGKDEALKILQNMAVFDKATIHTKVMLQKMEEQRRALEKEINALQWEIEFEQDKFKNLEESWKEKYERIYCENAALKETLELRTNEIKTLKSENIILNQQYLELLAMLDVKQQKMFQKNMSVSTSGFTDITALELAVLGACTCCNSSGGEPCSCARMSAATRKQLLQLRREFELEKKSKEEAFIVADAFRIAFEQQLKRRNEQTLRLNEVDKICRKETKRMNNWKHLMDDGPLLSKANKKSLGQRLMGMLISSADCRKLEALDDPQEILRILIDLLNDKEEALAHQRKVSYMLARSIEENSEAAKSREEAGVSGNHLGRTLALKDSAECTSLCHQDTGSQDSLCSAHTSSSQNSSTALDILHSLPSKSAFYDETHTQGTAETLTETSANHKC